eukprot:365008-Chlamydomonas_euryale.AAC.4
MQLRHVTMPCKCGKGGGAPDRFETCKLPSLSVRCTVPQRRACLSRVPLLVVCNRLSRTEC